MDRLHTGIVSTQESSPQRDHLHKEITSTHGLPSHRDHLQTIQTIHTMIISKNSSPYRDCLPTRTISTQVSFQRMDRVHTGIVSIQWLSAQMDRLPIRTISTQGPSPHRDRPHTGIVSTQWSSPQRDRLHKGRHSGFLVQFMQPDICVRTERGLQKKMFLTVGGPPPPPPPPARAGSAVKKNGGWF